MDMMMIARVLLRDVSGGSHVDLRYPRSVAYLDKLEALEFNPVCAAHELR